MNKRIERCTMAAAMALGSMAIAGLLNTAGGTAAGPASGIGAVRQRRHRARRIRGPEGRRQDYPLALTFAAQVGGKADYVADVTVAIHDGQGKPVLRATSEGPYMLVKLPAGDTRCRPPTRARRRNARSPSRAPAPHAVFEWK